MYFTHIKRDNTSTGLKIWNNCVTFAHETQKGILLKSGAVPATVIEVFYF